MNTRHILTVSLTILLASTTLRAGEVKMVSARMAFIHEGPGAYYPRVDVVRRNAVIEVGERDESGRWVRVKSYPMSEAARKKLEGGQKTLWIADRVLYEEGRDLDAEKTAIAQRAFSVTELQALEAVQAIRGLDEFSQGQMSMLKITDEMRRYVQTIFVTPEDYLRFKKQTIGDRKLPTLTYFWNPPRKFDLQARLKMGNAIALRMISRYGGDPVTDPALNKYVNLVAKFLVDRGPANDLIVRVLIVKNERITSLSSPGGIIIVTDSLLRACRNEAELAGVLAHEIVHIARRHGLLEPEMKEKAVGIDLDELWQELTEAEAKLNNKPNWVQPIEDELSVMADEFLTRTMLRGYALHQEEEADAFGIVFVYLGGYDTAAVPQFIQRVLVRQTTPWPVAMELHAAPAGRVSVINSIIRRYDLKEKDAARFEERFKKYTAVLEAEPKQDVK